MTTGIHGVLKLCLTVACGMLGALPVTAQQQVHGASSDLTSSYFLDRDFWQSLQGRHPDGLVVAGPRRGGLVYAPVSDETAVTSLRFSAAALYAGGPGARLSSALYLFPAAAIALIARAEPPAGTTISKPPYSGRRGTAESRPWAGSAPAPRRFRSRCLR